MALFPRCTFQVLLTGGVITPGERVSGTLVVEAPEPIPRADHVDLKLTSTAWAGYGGGNHRSVERRVMFHAPLHVDVLTKPMAAGRHEFPFTIDVPAWLPPAYIGNDCGIVHAVEMRVDVDWAVDPVANLSPVVAIPPRTGMRAGLVTRSPRSFHDTIVVEVTLASAVLAHDEPLTGQVALRSGHDARFSSIDLVFAGVARMTMARGDRRRNSMQKIRIPADSLRSGEAVPFAFRASPAFPPTFRSSFIDHDVVLTVSADVPWSSDPSFDLLLDVLPVGSTILGETTTAVVGGERLRRIAAAMAQSTGLREGRAPILVEGNVVGPIGVTIADAPRPTALGIDVDILFPYLELGASFRHLGMLEGFRASPLLPKALAERYLLRFAPPDDRAPVDEKVLAAFVVALLGDVPGADEVRFSDHHLGIHIPIPNDELPRMVDIARAAQAKAKAIAAAIGALPFPATVLLARPAWQATAAEQSAFLVPTGPSLYGLTFRTRVIAGEERVIRASLRTKWTKSGPTTHVDLDLREAPLPAAACTELERATPSVGLQAVRAIFPTSHALGQGTGATLDRPGFTDDPRSLLPVIEAFFGWVLDARGERRTELPYR